MTRGIVRLATLAALATALLAATPAAPARTSSTSALERSVLAEINAVRRAHGLAPLRLEPRLARAASAHSAAMAREGFFAHASPDGTVFWKRIARYYPAEGARYWAVGENLLWSAGSLDGARAVRMWMKSPPHRKVLLTRHWRDLGLAAVRATAAPGTFHGQDVTIVTADFGVRR